ncbi:sugar ABC transporter ATP-binding protein [Anaerofilum sp. BX8]|uniref:Sugar ABC transporter ATP-binding protein n=1 Tax=Anaerofilum hominis TaxID=2763016 RepID=A0A923L0U6_9FIRM|nr:sugar ABC transporter ATP-binding protein [Anaerofilum hominis]MBC5580927.1 sugar ABC transporter ATP-binding protein [Anaerofilum hominis]
MEKSEEILTVENLTKSFGPVKVLDNVQLSVKKGEVHALVGENGAGKSTMMNIVSGVYQRDSGRICLDGEEVNFISPRQACMAGIGFVHQEMSLCPHMSVAENVFMWNIPTKRGGAVDFVRLYEETNLLLRRFGAGFDARTRTGELNVAQQQVVEIARALSMNVKLIIFDEPTSSLTESETENLYHSIEMLKDSGVGVIYISHRMPEIFRICDRATVLRDGKYVDTLSIHEVTPDDIVLKMVGRSLGDYYPPKASVPPGKELLRVENLSGKRFQNISFTLKKHEILGFSGLVGSGRTEVMQALCGFLPYTQGQIWLEGQKFCGKVKSSELIRLGLFYLTEDRKANGLFLNMTTRRNISVTVLEEFCHHGFLNNEEEKNLSSAMIHEMDVRVASDLTPAGAMSGGNQQKVMIAKWLVAHPRVLIMDEPTRGIDVGSKSEIHHKLRKLSEEGIGVIVVSSELPEIIGVCDRVVVMHEGSVVGEVVGKDINEETLMLMASNRKKGVDAICEM